mgnify:CR=1 FL=1
MIAGKYLTLGIDQGGTKARTTKIASKNGTPPSDGYLRLGFSRYGLCARCQYEPNFYCSRGGAVSPLFPASWCSRSLKRLRLTVAGLYFITGTEAFRISAVSFRGMRLCLHETHPYRGCRRASQSLAGPSSASNPTSGSSRLLTT